MQTNVAPLQIQKEGRSHRSTKPRAKKKRGVCCGQNPFALPDTVGLILSPASFLTMPSLAGIPSTYVKCANSNVLTEIAAQCAEAGLGDSKLWENVRKRPWDFLERALSDLVDDELQGMDLTSTIDLYLQLQKLYEDDNNLYSLALGISTAAWFEIGDVLQKIEAVEPGLASSWYIVFWKSLCKIGYFIDFEEAKNDYDMRVDEGVFEDEELSEADMETMNPIHDVPDFILSTFQGLAHRKMRFGSETAVRRAVKHLNRFVASSLKEFIDPVLRMWNLVEPASFMTRDSFDEDAGSQVPFTTVCIGDSDNIERVSQETYDLLSQGDYDDRIWSCVQDAICSLRVFMNVLKEMAALKAALDPKSSSSGGI